MTPPASSVDIFSKCCCWPQICSSGRTRVDFGRDFIFGKVQTKLQAPIPAKFFKFDVFVCELWRFEKYPNCTSQTSLKRKHLSCCWNYRIDNYIKKHPQKWELFIQIFICGNCLISYAKSWFTDYLSVLPIVRIYNFQWNICHYTKCHTIKCHTQRIVIYLKLWLIISVFILLNDNQGKITIHKGLRDHKCNSCEK